MTARCSYKAIFVTLTAAHAS